MPPLLKSLLFSLLLALLLVISQLATPIKHEIIRDAWFAFGFFALLSFIIIFFTERGFDSGSFSAFMILVLGAIVLKIFLSSAAFFGFIYFLKLNPKIFIFPFLFFYVVYLVFETFLMLQLNKQVMKNEKSTNT